MSDRNEHLFGVFSISLDELHTQIMLSVLVENGDAAMLSEYRLPCLEGRMVSDEVGYHEGRTKLVQALREAAERVESSEFDNIKEK
jgi:hypothetical protein